jgi:hypothetical protein
LIKWKDVNWAQHTMTVWPGAVRPGPPGRFLLSAHVAHPCHCGDRVDHVLIIRAAPRRRHRSDRPPTTCAVLTLSPRELGQAKIFSPVLPHIALLLCLHRNPALPSLHAGMPSCLKCHRDSRPHAPLRPRQAVLRLTPRRTKASTQRIKAPSQRESPLRAQHAPGLLQPRQHHQDLCPTDTRLPGRQDDLVDPLFMPSPPSPSSSHHEEHPAVDSFAPARSTRGSTSPSSPPVLRRSSAHPMASSTFGPCQRRHPLCPTTHHHGALSTVRLFLPRWPKWAPRPMEFP